MAVQYQCAMSLDGFIAGPGGDMGWMAGYLSPDTSAGDLMAGTGALLVGRRTFGGDDPHKGTEHEGEPYGGGWEGRQFVLTHRIPERPVPGVTFVDDLERAVAAAREAAGEKNVGVLGAQVAAQCIEAGLLDEVYVTVLPVLLGDGVRLFSHPGGRSVRLEQLRTVTTPGATSLLLRVVR
ncbi:dihydrofolate reductase family protein [Actinomadura rupiterrae]|uniref:dihydrofolate reductase family protein n=1 Tax=Actinomadura rupiterrae TaxID=559627 RepID=UPI0020A5E81F|nr:dihydrofolate reductase family protein [Actinomadura rupiterrae]MCP2343287.1 dihydrofolate reductase [Actinomadura rupiterrae]